MPQRGWRSARDLAAVLAALAVLQLLVSFAFVGTREPGMLAAEVALAVLLAALAWVAHRRWLAARPTR